MRGISLEANQWDVLPRIGLHYEASKGVSTYSQTDMESPSQLYVLFTLHGEAANGPTTLIRLLLEALVLRIYKRPEAFR